MTSHAVCNVAQRQAVANVAENHAQEVRPRVEPRGSFVALELFCGFFRIASKRKRTERYGCVKNERTQGSTEHGRYASVFRRVRMDATSRCRGWGLGSGRVAPPHSSEQCRREVSKGSAAERFPKEMSEKLSPLVQGDRGGGQPPQLGFTPRGCFYSESISRLRCSKCKIAALHCCTFNVSAMGSRDL